MKKIAAVLVLLLLWASVPAQPELSLHLAHSTRVVLPNGLTLLIRERHDVNNVGVYLAIGAGQLTEDETQMGITNLLQNYLLEVPVGNFHDISTGIEAQGGVASAASGPDSAYVSMNVSLQAFPLSMKVLSDLMQLKQIDQKVFDTVKEDTLEEVRRSQEESYQALYGIFLQEFYSFHPYKVPVVGITSTVKGIKPKDLFDYYQRYYVPNNMVLAIVGNVETDRVIQLVSKYFAPLIQKPVQPKDIYYQPILDDNKQIQLQETGNIAWLFVGFSAPELKSEDYAPMQIVNSILGASMSSRIWLSIREKRGLSYELGSQYSARIGPSHFVIYVATSPENLGESKNNLLHEVQVIRDNSLTDNEMLVTKRRIIGQFILSLETNLAQAEFLAWSELSGKGIMFDEKYVQALQSVTPADVLRVSKKYLDDYILISVE